MKMMVASVLVVRGVYNERYASVIRYAGDSSASFVASGEVRYLWAVDGAIDALRLLLCGTADYCVNAYMNGSYLDRVHVGDTIYQVEYIEVNV